jgi:protein-tyrosine phosphatase
VIDMHCHVLAGIDDGPETLEGSLALARVAEQRGIDTIVATPHVSWRYGNDAATIAALVEQTNEALTQAAIAVRVLTGAEIAMSRAPDVPREELPALTLGGGPWLLLECPFTSVAAGMGALIGELEEAGHGVLLAHPERSPAFQRDPQMLESLVRGGVLTSITAGSLVGRFGAPVKRFALSLIEAELVHNVEAGLEAMTEWLTEGVPRALIEGQDSLPPRPSMDYSEIATRDPWWRRGPLKRAW